MKSGIALFVGEEQFNLDQLWKKEDVFNQRKMKEGKLERN